jgi:hypothetical protein
VFRIAERARVKNAISVTGFRDRSPAGTRDIVVMSQRADAMRAHALRGTTARSTRPDKKLRVRARRAAATSAPKISKDLSSSVTAQSHRSGGPRRAPRFQIRDHHRQARLARRQPRAFAARAFLERCGVDSAGMSGETN